jgi:hypothetical protein
MDGDRIEGPFAVGAIAAQVRAGTISSEAAVLEARGQTQGQLRRSPDWEPLTSVLARDEQHEVPQALERAVTDRYSNGYLVARFTCGIGWTIQLLACLLGLGLICLGTNVSELGLGWNMGIRGASSGMLAGLAVAILVALPVYAMGVLVRAQGEMVKASLDAAVHTSPFLTDAQRAKAMRL